MNAHTVKLRPVVGVNDGVLSDGATSSGQVDGGVHQRGAGSPADRPSDRLAGEGIHDHARIDAGLGGGLFGDISDPQLIRSRGGEVSVHQIAAGGDAHEIPAPRPASGKPVSTQLSHDQGHQLAVHHEIGFDPKRRLDPAVSVNTKGLGVRRSDRITQRQPTDRPVGGRSHPGAISERRSGNTCSATCLAN